MTEDGVCDSVWGYTIPSPLGNTKNDICAELNYDMVEVATSILNPKPFEGLVAGCKSTCRARVRAPALAVSQCTTRSFVQNFSRPWDEDNTDTEMVLKRTSFVQSIEPYDGQERLNILTGFFTSNQTSPQTVSNVSATHHADCYP